jgi:phosphoglycerate dehydrogenase-like enzyme
MGANGEAAGAAAEVLITWPDFDEVELGGELRAHGLKLRLAPKTGARSPAELVELSDGVAAAIVSTDPFDARVLEASPDLRVIARVGVGVDSIDLAAATEHGVAVTVTPGANEMIVAEHTVAMMLALLRRLPEHDGGIREGLWERTGPALPRSLRGATVGLIGYGQIGRLVAARLAPFEPQILVCDPAASGPLEGVESVDLDTLLDRSEVVSLHCPLVESTEGLIGAAEIERMGPGAILVNTARGGIIAEEALIAALGSGALRGAALDVFETEPPVDPRLLELPNLLMSPHNAALSERSVIEMTRMATASVIDVMCGRRPTHVINPDALEAAWAGRNGDTEPAGA